MKIKDAQPNELYCKMMCEFPEIDLAINKNDVKRRQQHKKYRQSDKGKQRQKKYQKKYQQSDKGKRVRKKYNKKYYLRKKHEKPN